MAGIALWAFSGGAGFAMARGKPAAAKPGKAEQAKTARAKADEQVAGRLAKAWAAELAGRHSQAITLAQPITKLSDPRYRWAAMEAAHVQARAYHQSGSARGRSRASQMWKKLRKLSKDPATVSRIEIAKALSLEAASKLAGSTKLTASDAPKLTASNQAKLAAAIGTLEPLLEAKKWNLATVEAAIDLSRLYIHAKRFDDAKKTLDYIVAYLGNTRNIRAMELPPALAKPFINAAKAALKNLKYDRNAGLAEFQAAEKLRHDKKFTQAARAYQSLIENFPQSDYAPRSGLHIGDCLLGLGQTARAIAHWENFIAPLPAGPWRGQAYISIIDYYLQEKLDLTNANKYAAMACNSLPAALADKPTTAAPANGTAPRISSAESWQLAAFDIHLRVGLVSFCQGKSAIAAEAFTAAKTLAGKATAESLAALIATAKTGKPVIPEDCRPGGSRGRDVAEGEAGPASPGGSRGRDEAKGEAGPASPGEMKAAGSGSGARPALALSLGTINLLIHRIDQADAFFDRVLGTPAIPAKRGVPARRARPPMPGATPAQRAFAIFGRGATLQARNKPNEAKEYFQASIQAHKQATWHDETLYRLATIIQDEADAKYGAAGLTISGRPAGKGKNAKPSAPPTPAQKQAIAKANKQRLAALVKAKSAALPYWHEIIQRYPKSPRCEQAFYNAGILLYNLAEAADAATQRASQSEAAWKKAAFMLDKFTEQYPKSPWAGDAYVRLMDVALERLFDIKLARQFSSAAGGWADRHSDNHSVPSAGVEQAVSPWALRTSHGIDESSSVYEAYLRAGLVAYLGRDYQGANHSFVKAQKARPRPAETVVAGEAGYCMTALCEKARTKGDLTPKEVADGDPKARLALQISDVYHAVGEFDKSISLCNLVLNNKTFSPSSVQESWAYFVRGRNKFNMGWGTRDPVAAMEDYMAAHKLAPKAPWSHRCLLYAANITYTRKHDADAAIVIWRRLILEYPAATESQISQYHIGVAYERTKRPKEARQAFEALLNNYPDSPYMQLVEQYHLKNIAKMEHSSQPKSIK